MFVLTVIGCSDDTVYHTIIKPGPDLPVGYTYIPDNSFEQGLMDLGYDTSNTILDSMVQTAHIENIRELHIDSLGIQELTGIEDFKSLEILYCDWNELTKLDLSNNQALVKLDCQRNKIQTINIKNSPKLTFVICQVNKIIGIDLSKNTNLETLYCSNNDLRALDVTQNKMLRILDCAANKISELSLDNPKLQSLKCSENRLQTLDLTNCNSLGLMVECFNNQLDTIQFGENNNLKTLRATDNNIESIDLSSCSKLSQLYLQRNKLKALNVCNGNNYGLWGFAAYDNPSLRCIQVDDPGYSKANWTRIDHFTSFSEDCGY